jgi:protein gp37
MSRYYNRHSVGGIDWCDYTFNPITGCKRGCDYCYARRIAERLRGRAFPHGFDPTFYPRRLAFPPPYKASRIFLGSMGDLCGDWQWRDDALDALWSPNGVQGKVFDYCAQHRKHQYIILTKNPGGLRQARFLPDNAVFGVSVSGDGENNLRRLLHLRELHGRGITPRVVVSYEPALSPLPELWEVDDDTGWLIIGAQTGLGAKPVSYHHVQDAVKMAYERGWRAWVQNNVIKQWPHQTVLVDSGGQLPWGEWATVAVEEPWPQDTLSMPEVN